MKTHGLEFQLQAAFGFAPGDAGLMRFGGGGGRQGCRGWGLWLRAFWQFGGLGSWAFEGLGSYSSELELYCRAFGEGGRAASFQEIFSGMYD